MTRRWAVVVVLAGFALGLGGTGCAMGTPISRDEQVRLLMEKNRRLQAELQDSQQKVGDLTAAGRTPAPAPAPEDPYRACRVQVGSLSGVVDRGGGPAKERLRLIIYPVDASGDVVKRAGRLDLEILEPGPKGQPPKPFGHWSLPADELALTWLSGLGEYGYVLRLPWPQGKPPAAETLLVRAKFMTFDGRTLATEAEVPVAPPAVPAATAGTDLRPGQRTGPRRIARGQVKATRSRRSREATVLPAAS